jgi:uridine phosphorylase
MAATVPDVAQIRRQLPIPPDKGGEALFLSRYYTSDAPNSSYGLAGPFMGAPQAAMLMETLAAWGAQRFVFLGWCGALVSSVVSGDIILPHGAFAEEGTSRAYGAIDNRVPLTSPEFQSELNTHLRQTGLDSHEGWVWSTDGVFRETEAKVHDYRRRGALAVEMELSALYTVGRQLNVELGAVLVVSDELSTLKWRPGFKSDRFKTARTAVCEAIASYVNRSPA